MAFEPIPLSCGSDCGLASSPVNPEQGKNLYLDNPRVVELPEEGLITFRFKRGPVTLREGAGARPGSASVDLTLLEIVAVKAETVSADSAEDYEKANEIDALFDSLRDEKEPSAE